MTVTDATQERPPGKGGNVNYDAEGMASTQRVPVAVF